MDIVTALKTDSSNQFIAYLAMLDDPKHLEFASDSIKNNKALLLKVLLEKTSEECLFGSTYPASDIIEHASDSLKADREFVKACIAIDGSSIIYASPELQTDEGLIFSALTSNFSAIEYLPPEVQNNKVLLLKILDQIFPLQSDVSADFLSDKLKNDKDIALAFCSIDGLNIKFFSRKLKNDRDVILTACKNDGNSIQFVNKKYRDDEEIALCVLSHSTINENYLSSRLRNDLDFALKALKKNSDLELSKFFSDEVLDNDEFILLAYSENPKLFKNAPERVKHNKAIVHKLLERATDKVCYFFKYLPAELRNDDDLVLLAIAKDPNAFSYAGPNLAYNRELALDCVKRGASLSKINYKILDREIVVLALEANPEQIIFVPLSLRSDILIGLITLNQTFPYKKSAKTGFGQSLTITVDPFQKLPNVLKRNEEFRLILIDAFFKTPHSRGYKREDFISNSKDIISTITRIGTQTVLSEDETPEIVLDLSDAISEYKKKSGS